MGTWTDTDDPNDPCPYCVSWVEGNPDDPFDLIPYGVDSTGELVAVGRLYSGGHAECLAAVAAYLDERDAENRRQGIR